MKALTLLSGGLDSRLAIKLMQEQGIEVEAVHFKLPFEGCCLPDCSFKFTQMEGIQLYMKDATKGRLFKEYVNIIKEPKHGHGSGMNPCIDCRLFMLKKARKMMKDVGARFIVTGEVLGERPMTQQKHTMAMIEKEAGLDGRVVRPLSGKLLEKTEAEKKGWVERDMMLDIQGRRRIRQLELAKRFALKDFPMPGGGCTLCEKEFAKKVRDLLGHKKVIRPKDVRLLKIGRHFRYNNSKIIVGRNEEENKKLVGMKYKTDYMFEVPDCGSPTTILQGGKNSDEVKTAARLTARYSDAVGNNILVMYGTDKAREMVVNSMSKEYIDRLRI